MESREENWESNNYLVRYSPVKMVINTVSQASNKKIPKKTLVTSPKSHGQFGKRFLSTKMDDYLPLSTTKNMISNWF